ncbi:S-methyl-5-thioribose kinase [Zobellella sp. DQSA1]|uniref:S-methyl-5-thioribose kinase n=1 Tax=Zobellella sp. DQSA1 TaxID=3342386 RepID=UPI0035C1E755
MASDREAGRMNGYRIFSIIDAIDYAREQGGLKGTLQAGEIGDGNLNLVFKVWEEGRSRGVIVKQALPFIRCVGESWPLTRDRARIEAEVLLAQGTHCPEHVVKVLHHDPALSVMLLEDLSSHRVWRRALLEGEPCPGAATRLGHYLARVHYYSSDFHLSSRAKRAALVKFINPELCAITEAVFFSDPYRDHERNNIDPAIRDEAGRLWADEALRARVAALKHDFQSRTEALLHGDLHTGSVMVTGDSLKVIDGEFGGYGPMGFDLGSVIGNLLLNGCGRPGRETRQRRVDDILALWCVFHREFAQLAAQGPDPVLAEPCYIEAFLRRVWQDSLGYAGTEMIRRTIGIAHVADLDGIEDPAVRARSQRQALALGRRLVLEAGQLGPADLTALAAG